MTLFSIYQALFKQYGPQQWWPADSPFEVMVGAILTQNTAWTNVEKSIIQLKSRCRLTAQSVGRLPQAELAELIRASGYFNVKAARLKNFCHWYLEQGGYDALKTLDTDSLRNGLLSVNGVGPETADDILLYAFNRPVFVVDAYTHRIFSRLGFVDDAIKYELLRKTFELELSARQQGASIDERVALYNEYHALIVVHGKTLCRSRPRCEACCLAALCKFSQMESGRIPKVRG